MGLLPVFRDDASICVAGDFHGDVSWVGRAIPAAARTGSSVLLQLGDFGLIPDSTGLLLDAVDLWCAHSMRHGVRGVQTVLVVPGNHEDWAFLDERFAESPGQAVQLSRHAWVLPKGFRFEIGGVSFLAVGGAPSLDYAWRVPGQSWWPTEVPTPEDVARAVAPGPVDVLLTHDAGMLVTPRVQAIIDKSSRWWKPDEIAYGNSGRPLVGEVVDGTMPRLHMHGHFHVRSSADFERQGAGPLRVESLHQNGYDGNLVALDLATLEVRDVEVR